MRVKANHRLYDVLEFTNDKEVIEEFAGKGVICKTRIDGVGFAAHYEYAIQTNNDTFWFSPGVIILKNSKGNIFWITEELFNEIFGGNNNDHDS